MEKHPRFCADETGLRTHGILLRREQPGFIAGAYQAPDRIVSCPEGALKHTAVLIVVFSFLLASSLLAQETYTKLATFECFYGQCQPGLPFSGLVETSPGTFFGSLTFGVLYTVS